MVAAAADKSASVLFELMATLELCEGGKMRDAWGVLDVCRTECVDRTAAVLGDVCEVWVEEKGLRKMRAPSKVAPMAGCTGILASKPCEIYPIAS